MSLFSKKKKKRDLMMVVQENPMECVRLIENSFLKSLFKETVTDIAFNGTDIFVVDNDIGRYKADIKVNNELIYELIKKIANYMLKPFSTKEPVLDVAFGDYRLNAAHPLIGRSNNAKVMTFSLRIIFPVIRIKPYDPLLAPPDIHRLLKVLVESYQSILISGVTGSGKTELQKYLVSFTHKQDRLIIIEESYETHIKELFLEKDITSWIISDGMSYKDLIKLAMRNNPDWLIIAETRGNEAYDFVTALMTGHSGITTIHSESAMFSLDRISNLCKGFIDLDEKSFKKDISSHLKIGIHMSKNMSPIHNRIIRRIEEIVEYIPSKNGYVAAYLYRINKDEDLNESYEFGTISDDLKKSLLKHNINLKEIEQFIQKEEI